MSTLASPPLPADQPLAISKGVDDLWEIFFDMTKIKNNEVRFDLGSDLSLSMNPASITPGASVQVSTVSDSGEVFRVSTTCTCIQNRKIRLLVLPVQIVPSAAPAPQGVGLKPENMFVHKLETARRLSTMVGLRTRTVLALATNGLPFPKFLSAVSAGVVDAVSSGTLECKQDLGRSALKLDLEAHCRLYQQEKADVEAVLGAKVSPSSVVAVDKEMAGVDSEIEDLRDRIRALKRKRADLVEKRSVLVALCDNDRAVRRFRRTGV